MKQFFALFLILFSSAALATNPPPSFGGFAGFSAFDGSSISFGASVANPYVGPYPIWLYGIGGTGYYDSGSLGANIIQGNGSIAATNPFPYGAHNTADGAFFAVGSSRPGVGLGFTDPSQSASYMQNGGIALGYTGDTTPVAWGGGGTFDSSGFTPTTPIVQSGATVLRKGMWLFSGDIVPYFGQVTTWTINGSNNVTRINVSGWYQQNYGGTSGAGTPVASTMYINPQTTVWASLGEINLNSQTMTCDLTSGSAVAINCSIVGGSIASPTSIPVNSPTSGLYPNGQFVTDTTDLPAGTYLLSVNSATQVTLSAPSNNNASGATLKVSNGAGMNSGQLAELDMANTGEPFAPFWATGTANFTSGSYVMTNVSVTGGTPRPNLTVAISGGSFIAHIRYVDPITGNITLDKPASSSTTGTAIQIITADLEGGAGYDCISLINETQSCFVANSNAYGYMNKGSYEVGYNYRGGKFGPAGKYGFRGDTRFAAPSIAEFAVGNATTDFWTIDGSGNEIAQIITANGSEHVTGISGAYRWNKIDTSGVTNWSAGGDNSSTPLDGSNSGTNYYICRWNDSGVLTDCPVQINRQFGTITLAKAVVGSSTVSSTAYLTTGTTPTNSGSCAINNQVGSKTVGSFKANGACASGTVILALATTAANGWTCDAHDMTTTADVLNETAYTTTGVTFSGSMVSGDQIVFKCIGF